jgi:hypothetical protein
MLQSHKFPSSAIKHATLFCEIHKATPEIEACREANLLVFNLIFNL